MGITHAVLLCGGEGKRLAPHTNYTNKALITITDRFVIDYPINTLVKMGITRITVILGGAHFGDVVSYLKDGSQFGVEINFLYQHSADGIAQAINLAKPYVENEDSFVAFLGDNIFSNPIKWADYYDVRDFNPAFAQVALTPSNDLQRFGVASFSNDEPKGRIKKIEEKPTVLDVAMNNYAITGCYLFNRDYFSMFKRLKKSQRGEFEITDILKQYLDKKELLYTFVNGIWADAGTWDSIAKIRHLVEAERIKI